MILHLAEDEKFIDHVIDMFEETNPDGNIYFIKLEDNNCSLRYIKSKHKNIISDTITGDKYTNVIQKLNTYEAVILHFLSPYKQEIIKNAPKSIHFHWMCWGGDLYNCVPSLQKQLLIDKKDCQIKKNYKGIIGDIINSAFPNLWNRYYLKSKGIDQPKVIEHPNYYKELAERINTVSTVLPTEVDLIKKYLNKNIVYKPFKYVTLEGALLKSDSPICNENNFLVGNSAHKSSNHINAFKKIYTIRNDELVYAPLSYGDKINADKVTNAGIEMFGIGFRPIIDFMPMEEYTKILLKCGNVVINSNRQQAIGNIIIALWYGARVFLNKKNPTYHYFKSIGIKVYKVSKAGKYKNLMSFEELAGRNRPILKRLYSREKVVKETKELVKYLCNK
ncbi:4-alpha-L-fucosyltransferase glycosyl transferase group 56 [Saccharicrinis carchari]|uniref:4-alpha-L-fucosyltransferase glycosyl transferase group 56 n=1 Tax=Saccharicrinis carchari TaxID=1168039 RepID=A0A521AKR0_SACCC|nr:TDP-N-acetylfucosamine:lipid II N-acetylfucosaminyltransferase [Saccharicrinis carchari]SMO35388.1 4-alpha-L-fucosyltransferase glycosyl transferase group 56 [Saccharicrinis carchari]